VPPFDREAALKTAEKALRQGRIDAAIAEYVKIVEAQPRDWNSANALGDLYVRANQIDKGVAQYIRIADHLATEGFYSKAAALFKKILKVKADDEYSLLQLAELSVKQGTLADAKQFFQQVAERRRARGDKRGAAEMSVRLGTLDPEDLDARLKAARIAREMGDVLTALNELRDVAARLDKLGRIEDALAVSRAAYDIDPSDDAIRGRLFAAYLERGAFDQARAVATPADLKQVAEALERAGRTDELLGVLADIAAADPADTQAKGRLALAYVARGDLEQARTYLSRETAGTTPGLWLALAELELRAGRTAEGRDAVAEALRLDREQAQAAVALGCKLAETLPDAAYQCIDAVAEAALAESDYAAAAVALHEFTTRVRHHLIALMRLVEICVDGGLEATMYEAQAQLADAYLEDERGLEARIIAEDLVAREPWNRANIDRFRRALVMLGESDPDKVIADRLSGESPFMATDKLDLNEGGSFDAPAPAPAAPPAAHGGHAPAPIPPPAEAGEVDLSAALEAEKAQPVPPAPNPAGEPVLPPAPPAAAPPRSLSQVFRGIRDQAGRQAMEENAAEQYRLALSYRDMGMIDEAITALEAAARSPRQRFDAASMLGRLLLERDEKPRAIEWLERAAEAPAPTPDAGHALLYDLAQALEDVGESARALALFMELEAEAGGYRDVAGRIEQLSKVQPRG
jgi:tetratricopeptide (TPR) repeat protein